MHAAEIAVIYCSFMQLVFICGIVVLEEIDSLPFVLVFYVQKIPLYNIKCEYFLYLLLHLAKSAYMQGSI